MVGQVVVIESSTQWRAVLDRASAEGKAVLVDFTAAWCGPCKLIGPVFETLSTQYPGAVFVKVDVDTCDSIAKQCGVRAMPTFQVFKGGRKVEELVGADRGKLEGLAARHGAEGASAAGGVPPKAHKYSVILPTYNERENIALVVWLLARALGGAGLDYEVIVVDDASPDGTADVVRRLQRVYGASRVILRPRASKLGLGTAYAHGLAACTGDYVILMDADLSHHPKYIPAMVQAQADTGCDVVIGSRYMAGGGVDGWDAKRKLVSCGANYLAATLLSPGVSDVTGSFRLYARPCLETLVSRNLSGGYAFQMEQVVLARQLGYSIREVPIVFVDRLYGASKLGRAEIFAFVKGLLRLFFAPLATR